MIRVIPLVCRHRSSILAIAGRTTAHRPDGPRVRRDHHRQTAHGSSQPLAHAPADPQSGDGERAAPGVPTVGGRPDRAHPRHARGVGRAAQHRDHPGLGQRRDARPASHLQGQERAVQSRDADPVGHPRAGTTARKHGGHGRGHPRPRADDPGSQQLRGGTRILQLRRDQPRGCRQARPNHVAETDRPGDG